LINPKSGLTKQTVNVAAATTKQ